MDEDLVDAVFYTPAQSVQRRLQFAADIAMRNGLIRNRMAVIGVNDGAVSPNRKGPSELQPVAVWQACAIDPQFGDIR
jgi:hypothetical protein